ncbi:chromobox protein homolog 5-like isoform X2 [Aphis gossypii]|uniref:chromobox protein homolog 5-like isoform X1 n=1 Tax=Aphis gossypii TaxID=80765 RepID=UPI002158B726|nr:chromobox protein homolog 5-like isoform X1 [Aphis gossypii]XP_050056288.1 chromobox protein homolog 5-like isoform X2 [Aphis gossypii]XP_050056289.1 chromobox protein homolog 5-like isoform X3 [Aphis gossypii]XP_050056290.1 chromobox protein homolog 5-like isoform X2 [Aphis gossypii]XP_050056291.1 chromobox protein homolog 5-like isoform X2 [Aphis gossypii]
MSSRRTNCNKKNECEGQEEEYDVEKILDKRSTYGIVEYFLKWKDYDDSYNSWEPMENMKCDGLIASFENQLKEFDMTQAKHGRKRARSNTNVKKTSLLSENKDVISDESEDNDLVSREDSDEVDEKDNNLTPINKNDSIDNTEVPKRIIAEKIISCVKSQGDVMYFIKIEGTEKPKWFNAKVVHEMCPQLLIKYCESNLVWATEN